MQSMIKSNYGYLISFSILNPATRICCITLYIIIWVNKGFDVFLNRSCSWYHSLYNSSERIYILTLWICYHLNSFRSLFIYHSIIFNLLLFPFYYTLHIYPLLINLLIHWKIYHLSNIFLIISMYLLICTYLLTLFMFLFIYIYLSSFISMYLSQSIHQYLFTFLHLS